MAKDLTKTRKDNESEEKRARKIKPLLLYQYLSSPRQYEERCDWQPCFRACHSWTVSACYTDTPATTCWNTFSRSPRLAYASAQNRYFFEIFELLFDDGFRLSRKLFDIRFAVRSRAEADLGNPLVLCHSENRPFTVFLSCLFHCLCFLSDFEKPIWKPNEKPIWKSSRPLKPTQKTIKTL